MLSLENEKQESSNIKIDSDRFVSQKFCSMALQNSLLQIQFQKSMTIQSNSSVSMRMKDTLSKKVIAYRSYSSHIWINLNQPLSSLKLMQKIRNVSKLIISLKYFDLNALFQVLRLLTVICPKRLKELEFEFCSVELRDYFMSLFRSVFLRRLKWLQGLLLSFKAQSIEQFASQRWNYEITRLRFLKRFTFETEDCVCGNQEFANVLKNLTRKNCSLDELAVGLSALAGASQRKALDQLSRVFSKVERIQSIKIDFSSWNYMSFDNSEFFWKLLLGLKNLKRIYLTMNGVSISNQLMMTITNALKLRTDIKALRLRFLYSDLNDLHMTSLAGIWASNKEIEALNIEIDSDKMAGAGIAYLIGSLSQLSCIKALTLLLKGSKHLKISDDVLIQLSSTAMIQSFSVSNFSSKQIFNSLKLNAQQFTNLTRIKLQLERFIAQEFLELLSLLSTCSNSQMIDVKYDSSEQPKSFKLYDLEFNSLKSLKVDLQKNSMGEDFFIYLFHQSLNIKTLDTLTIQARVLKPKESNAMIQSKLYQPFNTDSALREIHLSFESSEFSASGLDFILTSLGRLHNLIEMDLRVFGMSSDSEHWAKLPQLISALRCLQKASFLLWLTPPNVVQLTKELLVWWRVWIVYNIELFTFSNETLNKLDAKLNPICKVFYIKNT